ncbi:hypothetical protein HHI36_005523, partial [Cryptolaemus montrouzieri]
YPCICEYYEIGQQISKHIHFIHISIAKSKDSLNDNVPGCSYQCTDTSEKTDQVLENLKHLTVEPSSTNENRTGKIKYLVSQLENINQSKLEDSVLNQIPRHIVIVNNLTNWEISI